MATHRIIRMKFESPLHLARGIGGAYDTAEDRLRSDTISGAIAAIYAATEPGADVRAFMQTYKVSSAYPFMGSHYFLPKPFGYRDLSILKKDEHEQRKALKGIQYFETGSWQKAIAGETLEVCEERIAREGLLYDQPIQKDDKNKPLRLFVSELQQKVWIARTDGNTIVNPKGKDHEKSESTSDPYFFDRTYFHKDAGLYFMVEAKDEVYRQLLALMENLGVVGIGSDKSVGNGQFTAEAGEIKLNTPAATSKIMLLSSAVPLKEEIQDGCLGKSAYQLVKRGGFMAGTSVDSFRHLRKKPVYMLTEGSLIACSQMQGQIVDVTPAWNDPLMHRVFRDGRAFYVPVNL